MTDKAKARVNNEYQDLLNNPLLNIGATVGLPDPNNIMEWKCSILGPQDTAYANGLFFLKIKFPNNYPNSPPEVSFITPIYHINVNHRIPRSKGGEALGHVCISTLNWWKPCNNIKQVLNDIFALFYLSNPKSPYGLDRADEFSYNRNKFDEKVRHFTSKYASFNAKEKIYTNDWDFSYN